MDKILRCLLCIMLVIVLVIVMFDLYPTPQKTLNILFIIGLINYYSNKGSEE